MKTKGLQLQKGFSLVELMVAMVMGLIISFATLNMFSSTTSVLSSQDSEGKIREDGTFALQLLSRYIRNAGYIDWVGSPALLQLAFSNIPTESFRLTGASAPQDLLTLASSATIVLGTAASGVTTIHGCPGAYAAASNLLSTTCAAATVPTSVQHSITLAHQVRRTGDAISASGVSLSNLPDVLFNIPDSANPVYAEAGDCAGRDTRGTNAAPVGRVAVNRFYVDITSKRLQCIGNGNPNLPVAVAQNIEQLVFKYGQAQPVAPTPSASAASATADYFGDTTVGSFASASTTTRWPLVTTVEICVLAVGSLNSLSSGVVNYIDCGGNTVSYTDTRLRRAMKTTVTLRNRIRSIQ